MPLLQEIEWGECLLEPHPDSELQRWARKELGIPPDSLPYIAPVPWIVRTYITLISPRSVLHVTDLVDLVGLVVAQDNSCRYCYAATRMFLRIQGLPNERIRRLEEDFFTADLEPGERAALDFARRVSRANPPPSAADHEKLRELGFSDDAIRELVGLASTDVFLNRLGTLAALPTEFLESVSTRWWGRILFPLLRLYLASWHHQAEPYHLSDAERSRPFARLINAFDGLPSAGILRKAIDEALAADFLPRRAKLLVFAVVSRGVGSEPAETESRRLLGEEGMAKDEVESLLAHLASDTLDADEAEIASFARDTVRPEPARIQERGRVLCDRLGTERFLDLVGTSSLANAVARLTAGLSIR